MAKKQGVSYGPNTALIQGAGVAYKNYDNVPGMYSGLDKTIAEGKKMTGEAVKTLKDDKAKQDEQNKIQKEKDEALEKEWSSVATAVYDNAGGFMKADGADYTDTVAAVKALKEDWMKAQKNNDPELRSKVNQGFNDITKGINSQKELRLKIADPNVGLSVAVGTGYDKHFLTAYIGENYTTEIDPETKEKKWTITTGDAAGFSKTQKEIEDIAVLKNMKPFNDYSKLLTDYSNQTKEMTPDNLKQKIRSSIVPSDTNGLRAFLADKEFANGLSFSEVLTDKNNAADIKSQINAEIFDTDGKEGISPDEYKNFVSAIVSPDHPYWEGDKSKWQEESTRIATEQLANAVTNARDFALNITREPQSITKLNGGGDFDDSLLEEKNMNWSPTTTKTDDPPATWQESTKLNVEPIKSR